MRIKKIIMVILIIALLSSCQETPDNEAAINKNSTVPINTIEYNNADIPDSYKDSYSKNGANIIFDADIIKPDSNNIPIYEICNSEFNQEQVDIIINGLFGNVQLYAMGEETKSELEDSYIKALNDLNNKKQNPDSYENSEDYYQEKVDEIKKQIDDAPSTDTFVPIDHKMKTEQGNETYSGRGDLGKDIMAKIIIYNTNDNSFMDFKNSKEYSNISQFYPNIQDNGPVNLNITKVEAESLANEIVNRIGASYMKMSGYATGIIKSKQYPSSFDPQTPQAYLFYYTRCENGIQITFDTRSNSSSDSNNSYSSPIKYERLIVAVDDSGVSYIRWQGPIIIVGTSANNKIIPFADIIELAKNQLSYLYATYENQDQSSEKNNGPQASTAVNMGEVVSNEMVIQNITLGLMQIPVKNKDNENELIPVWDFFGNVQVNYDNGGNEVHYGNNKSLLTINAINGCIIDRNIGY